VVDSPAFEPLRVLESQISYLEEQIDKYNADLESLRSFVLPSGTPAAAHLHVARTVVRRAERCTWAAIHAFGGGVNPLTAKYLNRCSDLLEANHFYTQLEYLQSNGLIQLALG
jgi:cob(I)alamin adenosyltransferase